MPGKNSQLVPSLVNMNAALGSGETPCRSSQVCSGSTQPMYNKRMEEVGIGRFNRLRLAILLSSVATFYECQDLVPRDTPSLLIPRFHRSEIFGFVAGLGTTFAAVPDLVSMLRRRSGDGMNPRMAAIMGIFQILWVY